MRIVSKRLWEALLLPALVVVCLLGFSGVAFADEQHDAPSGTQVNHTLSADDAETDAPFEAAQAEGSLSTMSEADAQSQLDALAYVNLSFASKPITNGGEFDVIIKWNYNTSFSCILSIYQGNDETGTLMWRGSKIEYAFGTNYHGTLKATVDATDWEPGNYYAVLTKTVGGTTTTCDTCSLTILEALFPDVVKTSDCWYYQSVQDAVDKGLMSGYANGKFGPADSLPRGQAATILARYYDGSGDATDTHGFDDLEAGSYYMPGVSWALDEGIMHGKNSTTFDPNGKISRQELCVVIANCAAKYKEADIEGADKSKLDGMPDAESVSSYAVNHVAWCLNEGVIHGTGKGLIAPQQAVSRAEMATIITNAVNAEVI